MEHDPPDVSFVHPNCTVIDRGFGPLPFHYSSEVSNNTAANHDVKSLFFGVYFLFFSAIAKFSTV